MTDPLEAAARSIARAIEQLDQLDEDLLAAHLDHALALMNDRITALGGHAVAVPEPDMSHTAAPAT